MVDQLKQDEITEVDCFHVEVSDRPGEGSRVLTAFRHAGIELLGFSGSSEGGHKAQLDFIPEDAAAFVRAAEAAQIPLSGKTTGFLIQGATRRGLFTKIATKLALSEISITSAQVFCDHGGKYSGIIRVKPADVPKAAAALAVSSPTAQAADLVDLASDESFPASDAPPWTL